MTKIMRMLIISFTLSFILSGCKSSTRLCQQNNELNYKEKTKTSVSELENENVQRELPKSKEVDEECGDEISEVVESQIEESEKIRTQEHSLSENVDLSDISKSENLSVDTEMAIENHYQQESPNEEGTKVQIKRNGKLVGYGIEVSNEITPAAYTLGEYTNEGAFYQFYSKNDELLGRLPNNEVGRAIKDFGLSNLSDEEHFGWFTDQFNIYRGVECNFTMSTDKESYQTPEGKDHVPEGFVEQVIYLTNEERKNHGLSPLTLDETAMEYAEIRSREIEDNFSHTDMSYGNFLFVENIAKGHKSPQEVVDGWMASPGHRDAILADYSDYGNRFGVGCIKGSDGKYYWVQEFIIWDANA